MKRTKRHKIKQETPETSTSRFRDQKEHDLAYYIHDRVELMHQVFSVIKPKDLKAMAPECVYHITVDDLQELCTEELLGISSKRLCAILDGAEPPTDTESSSSENNMETISLDSISSDDEVLSQPSSKKKHKHKKHKSRSKHKHRTSKSSEKGDPETREEEDQSKASRAGLTVLELLELQARARAIRAQLQQDNAHATSAGPQQTQMKQKESSEDEIEIKEEPAEVVEISSEDEKPNIENLPVKPPSQGQTLGNSKTVSQRIKDLTVTVPQTKPSKKIVLNRTKSVTTTSSNTQVSRIKDSSNRDDTTKSKVSIDTARKANASSIKANAIQIVVQEKTKEPEVKTKVQSKSVNNKTAKLKKKQKKKDKLDKEEDHDEITLQLSDTEKMDLLEDLDRKNYENFTSSSEDSESSSESDSNNDTSQDSTIISQENDKNASSSQETNASVMVHEVTNVPNTDIITDDKINLLTDKEKKDEVINAPDKDNLLTDKENKVKIDTIVEYKEVRTTELGKVSKETGDNDINAKEASKLDTNENVTISKRQNLEGDKIKDTDMSSNKITIIELDTNESLKIEVETCETTDANTILENQSMNTSANKNTNFEAKTNKSLNKEVETCESTEATTIDKNHMESHKAIKSIIDQLRKDNFTESEANETQLAMRSLIVRVDSENTEDPSNENTKLDSMVEKTKKNIKTVANANKNDPNTIDTNKSIKSTEEGEITSADKDLSEGEIVDQEEETQTNNTKSPNKSNVVCVSDEDVDKRKKKKKKEKKSKKDKKTKKSKSDFCKGADQNFFREEDANIVVIQDDIVQLEVQGKTECNTVIQDIQEENNKNIDDNIVSLDDDDDDDDIYEILEISDDSSCYEVEGISVSKEPTAAEIAALSAKIDEIHTNDIIFINEDEEEKCENKECLKNSENMSEEIENVSWRDRYLGSKKVKRVLTTSNILNALRKKNKKLKLKLEESKEKIQDVTERDKQVLAEISDFVEGSIEHFNTLPGSSKYVDPLIPELPKQTNKETEEDTTKKGNETGIKQVTKEMEKDAKQLLKMYKRLLKYNDMNINKKKDPNKKKKKKHKKNKEKDTAINVK